MVNHLFSCKGVTLKMIGSCPRHTAALGIALALFLAALPAVAQNSKKTLPVKDPQIPVLAKAAVCEDIKEFAPLNPAVVFSIAIGKVSCFSLFDPVPGKTVIYHTWYHRDNQSTRKRLALKPPRWATFSSIQLRQTDKGPWRVEISDVKGRVFKVIRFSITD